uniref:Fatty acid desaturase domain-containing protein n=1 Tax=Romanomermis culicivorax TaxID=13658 RepID=A0A915ITQ0_ROMCU
MTIDPSMKYVAACCAFTHLLVACLLSECPFSLVFFYSLVVGPLFSNALTTAMHETTHNLAFAEESGHPYRNKMFVLWLNTFLAFPGIAEWNKLQVPKSTHFVAWNWFTVAIFDALLFFNFGWKSLFYMIFSSWMNDTIFVQGSKNYADHMTIDGQEGMQTTSYYGWFNYIRSTAIEYYSDDQFIQCSLFGAVISMLKAKPREGITKHICLTKTN